VWAFRGPTRGWPARLLSVSADDKTATFHLYEADGRLKGERTVLLDPDGVDAPWRLVPLSGLSTNDGWTKDAYVAQRRPDADGGLSSRSSSMTCKRNRS
jgi:hypothetical protein